MPRPYRNDAFVLKHRLAGAAILIGFAVIVLPMLLGGPAQTNDSDPDDGGISGASDTKVFRSNITPIGGETPSLAGRPGGEADAALDREADRPAPPPPAGDDAPQTTAADGGAVGDSAEDAGRDDQRAALESGDSGPTGSGRAQSIERGWIVQVGTFKNQDNVEKIVAKLENGGFDSSSTEVETSDGVATRVWVGPFETRVEAARIKSRVKQRTGSEGLIVAYP